MNPIAIAAARAADLLRLIEPDTELTRIAGTHGGEWAGPCPFCGGTDRCHVNPARPGGGRWYCRQCTPRGGDAIDYVRRRQGYTFGEAVAYLADLPVVARPRGSIPVSVTTGLPPSPDWQAAARRFAEGAIARLAAPAGAAGQDYLAQRGLGPATWQAWGLGCARPQHPLLGRPVQAITLPWCTADGAVTAVQHRFIGPDLPRGARYGQRRGGRRSLYGLPLLRGADLLILCEGELNALSLWQVAGGRADVLSWGPQDGIRNAPVAVLARQLAAGYRQMIVWADTPECASGAAAALAHPAVVVLTSQAGRDANDLLVSGELADRLAPFLR